jgi:hypothetical protein
MSHYWDAGSLPTMEGDRPLRLPAPPDPGWEYARLITDLYAGGSASVNIQRPSPSSGELIDSGMIVEAFDAILPGSTRLLASTLVKIVRHPQLAHWMLDDWTAIRR